MKYLESNLVFGHEGEVWAYYEWEPYNYSCKPQYIIALDPRCIFIHDHFRSIGICLVIPRLLTVQMLYDVSRAA